MSLANLPIPSVSKDIKVATFISNIVGAPECQEVLKHVRGYPPRSLTQPIFRALTYTLIRTLRPCSIIEIGTMFAGTAELFASALMANGHGMLTTIDPYGSSRAPPILDSWPKELRPFVEFRAINSMDMFTELVEKNRHPDIIFVDGNHQYEYALFDLLASARSIKREGIIIMDNYDLPGVVGACKTFEDANPAWRPIRFSAHPSFGSRGDRMTLDGLYRFYVAPSAIPVNIHPLEFLSGNLAADGVRGFKLTLAEPSPGGRLHYQLYLRIYPWNIGEGVGDIEEFSACGDVEIARGSKVENVQLSMPLATTQPIDTFHRRVDIVLLFEANSDGAPLMLADEPMHDLIRPRSTVRTIA